MPNQITLAGIALDDHHEWTDEYQWSAVEQEQERSLSGALIVPPRPHHSDIVFRQLNANASGLISLAIVLPADDSAMRRSYAD